MMDYLSDFPGPSKDAAIRYVIRVLRSEDSTTIRMDDNALYALVSEEYDAMGPMGSQACWLAVTSNMLITNTKARLAQFCDKPRRWWRCQIRITN